MDMDPYIFIYDLSSCQTKIKASEKTIDKITKQENIAVMCFKIRTSFDTKRYN